MENQKCGLGFENYRDGSDYEGNWERNMKHGKGVLTFSNGIKYMGDFRNNK